MIFPGGSEPTRLGIVIRDLRRITQVLVQTDFLDRDPLMGRRWGSVLRVLSN